MQQESDESRIICLPKVEIPLDPIPLNNLHVNLMFPTTHKILSAECVHTPAMSLANLSSVTATTTGIFSSGFFSVTFSTSFSFSLALNTMMQIHLSILI